MEIKIKKFEKTKDAVQVQIISDQHGLISDVRGFYLTIPDQTGSPGVLGKLELLLGDEKFRLFSWIENHDGKNFLVTAVVKEPLSTSTIQEVTEIFAGNDLIIKHEVLEPILDDDPGKADGVEVYNSSWYWPLDKRLPRSAYNNPNPIRIAQADTGISLHPDVIGGFQPAESMDFYFPKGERKGKGVICWGAGHPMFITHGTSTGGMMIGQPADSLELHGMTPRGVVELVPCRVTDSVVLAPEDVKRVAECIHWAIDEGIKVVNVSLGAIATPNDPAIKPLTEAIERAYKNGVIVCCASGQYAPGMVWPGVYSLKGWCITCGPSNQNKEPSAQSIWILFQNGYVTVAAPGVDMPQASWKDGECYSHVAELGASEGSSYSTALTSSLAALWWAKNHEALSRLNPRDVVPVFRNSLIKACNAWNGNYLSIFGPGIVDPNKLLQQGLQMPEDYTVECAGIFRVERAKGGTYKNVTLYAHGGGSVHVLDPIFVEGKLTLKSESSATILLPATVICRELEIICNHSATINSDDLEYYDSCTLNIDVSSTCNLYIAAEGPISGSVNGEWYSGSTLNAWIYWRQGKKIVDIARSKWSISNVNNDWGGRWA